MSKRYQQIRYEMSEVRFQESLGYPL